MHKVIILSKTVEITRIFFLKFPLNLIDNDTQFANQ